MKRMTAILITSVATAMAMAAPARANLVTNGDFETTSVAPKGAFAGNVTGWAGGTGLTFVSTAAAATDGTYMSLWSAAVSPTGGNFVFQDGDPAYNSAFSQLITGLEVGAVYELKFSQAAGQQGPTTSGIFAGDPGFSGATTERWQVTFGGDTLLSSLMNNPSQGFTPWMEETMTFRATSTSQLLSFLAVGTPSGLPPMALLDGLSMEIPEPGVLGLMGLGLISLGLRRRNASAA